MENQQQRIKGYRVLSEEEIARMNSVKERGEALGVEIASLEAMPDIDKRWLSIGKTHVQQGIMAVVRSIAQPTTF